MVMTSSGVRRSGGTASGSDDVDQRHPGGYRALPGEGAESGASADDAAASGSRPRLRLFGRQLPLPASRPWRIALGASLVGGGVLGFLPILGFWMLPLGLFVLSVDSPLVRRWRRRGEVRYAKWRKARRARGTDGDTGDRAEDSNG